MQSKQIGYQTDINGTVIGEIFVGDKVITKKQAQEIKRSKIQNKLNEEKFVKYLCYSKLNSELEGLPTICQLIFFFFVRNLHYDGSVRFRNYVKITTKDIMKKFKISERSTQRKIKKLTDKRLIKKHKNVVYINPEIAHRGCVSEELIKIFE